MAILYVKDADGNKISIPSIRGTDGIGISKTEINTDGELVLTYSNGETANLGKVVGENGQNGIDGNQGDSGADGIGISSAEINENGELVLTYTNSESVNLGKVVGSDGTNGIDGQDGKDGTSVTISSINESAEDDGNNTVTFSDGTTLTVKNGSKGSTGDKGDNGYTPVKGTDYWTEDDLTSMQNDNYAYITAELAKRGQLKPEFANSIEECTDTAQLYVLPDGYIYTYSSNEEEVFTDVLSEIGYTADMRINSSGAIVGTNTNGSDVTGYIPCKTGDVIRVSNMDLPSTYAAGAYWNTVAAYDESKVYIAQVGLYLGENTSKDGWTVDVVSENDQVVQFTIKSSVFGENVAYLVINAKDITDDSEVYVNSEIKTVFEWVNTGIAFVSSDYTDEIADHETRLKLLEANEDENEIPEYWLSELETKADTIQQTIEVAGRNKSAFLWYTDAHWQTNSKMSPALLNYLAKNTPINKVNFGGDIINDPAEFTHDNIKYAYEWRKLIADLPNHHSVYGNHDVNHHTTDVSNISYALLLADEEVSDMIVGGDSYYYIDNPSEKTRYLYLSYLTNNHDEMVAQGQFIVDAIKSAQDGWHIIAIAHRWFQYTSSSAPTVGSIPAYESEILQIFDKYNARTTHTASNYFYEQDFADGKGKVEFCIGGHIHVDYDFTSTGGIPVIITASDTNQERSSDETEDSGTVGTITESAVFAIIADYTNNKITVIGVGRGTSREINY